jgi:hypothetical protein
MRKVKGGGPRPCHIVVGDMNLCSAKLQSPQASEGWILGVERLSGHPQLEFAKIKKFWSRMTFAVVPIDSPDSLLDTLSELVSKHGCPHTIYCEQSRILSNPKFTNWATERNIQIGHMPTHNPKKKASIEDTLRRLSRSLSVDVGPTKHLGH